MRNRRRGTKSALGVLSHVHLAADLLLASFSLIAILISLSHSLSAESKSTGPTVANNGTAPLDKSQLDSDKVKLENRKLGLEIEKLQADNAKQNERLNLEMERLRIDNANSVHNWSNLIYLNVSVIVGIVLGFVGLIRYLNEKKEESAKREDARFEDVVKGLGAGEDQERVGAAVLLPTYLRKGYERFYVQVFNLAAGYLRTPLSARQRMTSAPLTLALTSVFREAYPRARDLLKTKPSKAKYSSPETYLNAAGVQLEQAFLNGADLREALLREASLREAKLNGADLTGAVLERSSCFGAEFKEAILSGQANLIEADFTNAVLEEADLSGSTAQGAKFTRANLTHVRMIGGRIGGADFTNADLTGATFTGVAFGSALAESAANPERAKSLQEARFDSVSGLTQDQVTECEDKGATFTNVIYPHTPDTDHDS